MAETIFTRIIKGEIPSFKIYEDDKTLAFLDIHPITEGHTLVIPKREVEFVWDLSPEDYQALWATCQKVAKHLREASGQPFIGSKIMGIDVPHAHVHLIPFSDIADYHHSPDLTAEPDFDKLAAVARKLKME